MEIYESFDTIEKLSGSAVTVGKFNGIHRGHRVLIDKTVKIAREEKLLSVVVSIEVPGMQRIYSRLETAGILSALGVDVWVILPLTPEVMHTEAADFLKGYLIDKLSMKYMVSGYDFTFGKEGKGNVDMLLKNEATYGYKYVYAETFKNADGIVSSTMVREALSEGRTDKARECLGRDFFMEGTVIHGAHIGTGMTFPTLNLEPEPDKFLPKYGVYAVFAEINGEKYPAVANIGVKPTVRADGKPVLEVHLFDFKGDLYGENCKVYFVRFIRDERKFSSIEELKAQIECDVETTKLAIKNMNHL